MTTFTPRRAAGALVLLAWMVSPLYAFDATGTWTGAFSCRFFDGAKSTFKMKPSTLLIAQTGSAVKASMTGTQLWFYDGSALNDDKKPNEKGEILLIQCGTDDIAGVGFAEMMRVAVKTNPDKGTGSFSGVSIPEGDFGGGNELVTCKYKFKRTSTAPPRCCPSVGEAAARKSGSAPSSADGVGFLRSPRSRLNPPVAERGNARRERGGPDGTPAISSPCAPAIPLLGADTCSAPAVLADARGGGSGVALRLQSREVAGGCRRHDGCYLSLVGGTPP